MATRDERDDLAEAKRLLGDLGEQTYLILTGGKPDKQGHLTGGKMVPTPQRASFTDDEVGRLVKLRDSYLDGGWSRDGHLLYLTADHGGQCVPVVRLERLRDLCAALGKVPAAAMLVRDLRQQQARALAARTTHAIPLAGVDAHHDPERRRAALAAHGFYAYALPSGEVRWVTGS